MCPMMWKLRQFFLGVHNRFICSDDTVLKTFILQFLLANHEIETLLQDPILLV